MNMYIYIYNIIVMSFMHVNVSCMCVYCAKPTQKPELYIDDRMMG